jgi:hypothetical protein
MRTWNRVLISSAALSSIVVGCADLSKDEEDNGKSRLVCESLTTEPTELEECANVASDEELAAARDEHGLRRCATMHPTLEQREAIEAEVTAATASFAPGAAMAAARSPSTGTRSRTRRARAT